MEFIYKILIACSGCHCKEILESGKAEILRLNLLFHNQKTGIGVLDIVRTKKFQIKELRVNA
jgi:hypothetical protein